MSIPHGLTTEQINQVQGLVDQGLYSAAWQQLSAWGDSYADNAADVTGTPTSAYGYVMHDLVKQHWENTAGPGAYEQQFDAVAKKNPACRLPQACSSARKSSKANVPCCSTCCLRCDE